jgi:hypothetical protein
MLTLEGAVVTIVDDILILVEFMSCDIVSTAFKTAYIRMGRLKGRVSERSVLSCTLGISGGENGVFGVINRRRHRRNG